MAPGVTEGGDHRQGHINRHGKGQSEDAGTDEYQCASADTGDQILRETGGNARVEGGEEYPAADPDEEYLTEAGGEDDGFCFIDVDEENEPSLAAPRTFANPLLRDHEPREQRLEMLIPPHAFPWVTQRIMGGGDPQGTLTSIAAFIDEVFAPEQAEVCEAGQVQPDGARAADQCPAEPAAPRTESQDSTQREPSAERRT